MAHCKRLRDCPGSAACRPAASPCGSCAAKCPGTSRSGSNQTMVLTPFFRAWSLTARRPLGNRVLSTSQVPVLRPLSVARIPAGVHPPVVELDAFFEIAIDEQLLVGLVGLDHLGELVRTASVQSAAEAICRRAWACCGPASSDARCSAPASRRRGRTAGPSAACEFPRRAAASC